MKVYIAGASKELATIQHYRDLLIAVGVEITHDWTELISSDKTDTDLTSSQRLQQAKDDILGVKMAHFMWMIIPENNSKGAWIELGYALGVGVPVIVTGNRASIFCDLAAYGFDTHDQGFRHLVSLKNQFTLHGKFDEKAYVEEWRSYW